MLQTGLGLQGPGARCHVIVAPQVEAAGGHGERQALAQVGRNGRGAQCANAEITARTEGLQEHLPAPVQRLAGVGARREVVGVAFGVQGAEVLQLKADGLQAGLEGCWMVELAEGQLARGHGEAVDLQAQRAVFAVVRASQLGQVREVERAVRTDDGRGRQAIDLQRGEAQAAMPEAAQGFGVEDKLAEPQGRASVLVR